MSRIGKQPIQLPSGVTATLEKRVVTISGPKGKLQFTVHPYIGVKVEDTQVVCEVVKKTKQSAALWGTTRACLANMVTGVTDGFRKQLELHGVGYRANLKGTTLELALGFSHPVIFEAPEGISFIVEKELITIEGYDAGISLRLFSPK